MKLDLGRLRESLLGFYDRRRRDLPWRGEEDPYRILVSEIMLQQTRVETVLGYYEPWLERFPDVATLAAADEGEVLKAWEGLGYYRRARNLHAAARMARERWDGALPGSAEELRGLPGVGEYTAGAVASIGFGEVVPAVDGNVRRVLARLLDVAEPSARWLRETAGALVDPERPGDWNQALMELGQAVCGPRGPRCGACPVAWSCAARIAGTVDERPAPSARRPPRKAIIALVVLRRASGEVLLIRRPEGGLLGGMWAFPEREVERVEGALDAAVELAGELLGGDAEPVPELRERCRPLPHVRHRFTHIDATYVPWTVEVEDAAEEVAGRATSRTTPRASEERWMDATALEKLAVPVAQREVLASHWGGNGGA